MSVQLPEEFNVATYFVDRNVAEGRGNRVAIECGDAQVTYGELLGNVNRAGNTLGTLGVRREERVALLLQDTPEFAYCFFGAIKMGAIAVPLNTLLKPHEYRYLLNDCRARVLVVSPALLAQVEAIPREELPYLEHIVVAGEGPAHTESLPGLMQEAAPKLDAARASRDEPAFWLYSSGSTGSPKGCVHLHHDMVVCAESYARAVLRITEHDRCFSVAKLFFAYGLGNALYFPFAVGATAVLWPGQPSPQNVFAVIQRYRPTLFYSVPTNYAALLAHQREGGGDFDLSSVRQAVSAGEALPAAIFERFKQRFGVEILDAIGSTEACHMFIANRPGEVRPGSSGKVLDGFAARIVDEHGNDVPDGEIGNLLIRSDAVCAFYWNQHEKSKETFVGPWLRTGDKYYRDGDGYYWYAGRADDMLKVSGSWVSPIEIEAALVAHDAVLEAAVVGREDENRLMKPAAFVVLRDGRSGNEALAAELKEHVSRRLSGFKSPRWVEFVAALPKTATGKIQRFKLREMAKAAP